MVVFKFKYAKQVFYFLTPFIFLSIEKPNHDLKRF